MVSTVNLSPDPSNRPDENFLSGNIRDIVTASSDSEEEDFSYEGYEALPQEFIENNNIEADDSDSPDSSCETNEDNQDLNCKSDSEEISAFDLATKSELTELWNSTENNWHTDIVIDSTKEEQIKNAMAGFKLPSSAIPPWAEHIPEEEWKKQLINRVALSHKVTPV